MNLHIGPQPAVSTSVRNSVDIVPLEREVNLNVNESVELLENILNDLLKSFDSIKTNGWDHSEVQRLATFRNGLKAFGYTFQCGNHAFISFKQSLTWYIFAKMTLQLKLAVSWWQKLLLKGTSRRPYQQLQFPGTMPSLASTPPSLLGVNRTQHTSTEIRGVRPNKLNIIPHFLPQIQIVKGFEMYVSGSLLDPNYRIHTITEYESGNWLKQ